VRYPRRQRGHSLAGTVVFLVLAMMLWGAVHRQAMNYVRIEKACRLCLEQSTGCRRAMAQALSLLETGEPPLLSDDTYSCRIVVGEETYVAVFTRTGTEPLAYHVEVCPKTHAHEDDSPPAPKSF